MQESMRNIYKSYTRFDEGLRAITEEEDMESKVERTNIWEAADPQETDRLRGY